MSTVTIGVASLGDTQRRASAAFRGKKQGARISFATEDLLWKTLTPKRWAILKLMAGQGSMAIREIARRRIVTEKTRRSVIWQGQGIPSARDSNAPYPRR
jgi:predicted transcriptional regulator